MQLNGLELEFENMRDVFAARRALGDKPLLICDGETLTYAQAHERANRIAHELIARGIGPECPDFLSCSAARSGSNS